MATRAELITRVLRHPAPVRLPLAYEQRGSVVQLLAPGTTDPTWTAAPNVLAEAIDTALTAAAGHALVVHHDGLDMVGTCECGARLGRIRPGTRLDALAVPWERHTLLGPIRASA